METQKIGRHTVEIYNAIDELPIARFHKYQKLLLVDAGIGADITAFDQRIEKVRRFLLAGKPEKAGQELENLRQCVYLIQSGLTPKHRAFAVLVASIDGERCDDLRDEALERVLERLADVPHKWITATLEAVKKKIDAELTVYFPSVFNTSDVKEYYNLLRERTLALLDGIVRGEHDPERLEPVERLTTRLLTYSNPQSFSGSDGLEVQYDRQFEDLCLMLAEQLHVDAKGYTVLEFYNAYEFIRERAKQAEKTQKRPNLGR